MTEEIDKIIFSTSISQSYSVWKRPQFWRETPLIKCSRPLGEIRPKLNCEGALIVAIAWKEEDELFPGLGRWLRLLAFCRFGLITLPKPGPISGDAFSLSGWQCLVPMPASGNRPSALVFVRRQSATIIALALNRSLEKYHKPRISALLLNSNWSDRSSGKDFEFTLW
jgi:hypothetical protein